MTEHKGGPAVDPADQPAAPEYYDLANWPMLRGSSGEYLTIAADSANSKNLLMRFKVEQVIPPSQAYPGVLYMQILQVNILAYNISKEALDKLGELGGHLDTREYKNPEGHKVQAHLIQRLYLPIAIEPMAEDTALGVAVKNYGGMLMDYTKALCEALGLSDYCDVPNLIQSIRAQGKAEKESVTPVLFTHAMWVQAKGNPAANAAWLLSGKSKSSGAGFGGYALPSSTPKAEEVNPLSAPSAAEIALDQATQAALQKFSPPLTPGKLTELPSPSNEEIQAAIAEEMKKVYTGAATAQDTGDAPMALSPLPTSLEVGKFGPTVDSDDDSDDDYKLN